MATPHPSQAMIPQAGSRLLAARNARALASSRARVADATEAGVRGATLALARNREGPRAALPTTTASEYGSSDSESYVNPRARVRALAGVSSARGVDSIANEAFSSREERIRAEPNAGRGVRWVPARGGGGMTYRARISTRGGRSETARRFARSRALRAPTVGVPEARDERAGAPVAKK